jgi:hypothetical protein
MSGSLRYVKAALGFAIGGLAGAALLMALQVCVGGYAYRGAPPLGNVIFGAAVLAPYVLCGSLGFAFGLRLFGVAACSAQSLLIGALFVVAISLLSLALNRLFRINPFEYSMVAVGMLMFAVAIFSALVPRAFARPRDEARALEVPR